jgi:hypothetical protein
MAMTRQQEKKLLRALLVTLVALICYRLFSAEAPRTAPLTFTPGMVVSAPVRKGLPAPGTKTDPLIVFLERRVEKYPGMSRDLFRMSSPGGGGKLKSAPVEVSKPVETVTLPTVTVPVKSPEEIAAETAKADLSKFRFLGYLTDKDSSLFLSKEGELFIVKSGDVVQKTYQVKSVGKDHVVLQDTITKVEVKIDLTGGAK